MWVHIGTKECWFSISDTCIRLHGKPMWLFFKSSIQRFPGGLFLFKNKCIEQRYACYSYRKCKSKHEVKTLKCSFSMWYFLFTRSYLPNIHNTHLLYSTRCNYSIITTCPQAHTTAHMQFHSSACAICHLFYLASPPPCSHLELISPVDLATISCTYLCCTTLMNFSRKSLCWHA